MQRRFTKTPKLVPVGLATPPSCDDVFEGDIPPRSRCKTVSGSVVAVAAHVAHATPDHAAMLPLPPAHFDANAVAEFGLSMTIIMSPRAPSESLAAFARKSVKRVVCVDAAPEFLKHAAAWFAASKTGRGAAGSNLKIHAVSAALIGIFVSCLIFPNILVVTGSYGFAIGMGLSSWRRPVDIASEACDSCWEAPTSLQAAFTRPWPEMRPHAVRRVQDAFPGDNPRPLTSTAPCRPQDAVLHPAVMLPWSSPDSYLLPDSTFLTNDPHCVTFPLHFTQNGMLSSAESFSTAPNILLSSAVPSVRVMTLLSPPAPPHPDAFIEGKPLPLLSAQTNELRHASNPSTKSFVPNHVFGAIFILVAAVRHAMHVMRRCSANKLSIRTPFGRAHRSVAVSAMSVFLCCASCLHGAAAADIAVSVDPVTGQNVPNCGQTPPCKTIEYAVHTRRATSVLLSEGIFNEISIYVDSIAPLFSVSGSRNNTIFDCGRRGPAFIIANTSVAITGVTFQNCVNFNASSTGGAISAHSNSVVAVTNCAFYNNTAQTGGAIGAISSALTVTSSLFENNTATCPDASAACSAWGGAIGAVEAQSVTIAATISTATL